MFDKSKLDAMPEKPSALPDIQTLDLEGLLELQAQIEARLPPTRLEDIDLTRALTLQYHRSQALLSKVMGDGSDVPANQKAQVANTCAATLKQLIDMQGGLYNQERMKTIESALIKALKTLPKETQEVFINHYEAVYGEMTMRRRFE